MFWSLSHWILWFPVRSEVLTLVEPAGWSQLSSVETHLCPWATLGDIISLLYTSVFVFLYIYLCRKVTVTDRVDSTLHSWMLNSSRARNLQFLILWQTSNEKVNFLFQHLAQGHFGMSWDLRRRPSGWRTTALPQKWYVHVIINTHFTQKYATSFSMPYLQGPIQWYLNNVIFNTEGMSLWWLMWNISAVHIHNSSYTWVTVSAHNHICWLCIKLWRCTFLGLLQSDGAGSLGNWGTGHEDGMG